MEQKTILLNGGRVLDVAPVEGADEFLVELLGAAPSKPAVPTLRVLDSNDGRRSVGVFIGSKHVGFLSQATDAELVATLQACDLHGAVARARGNLVPSWDRPGKVAVKVNLADSARLLGDPAVEPPGQTAPRQQADSTPAPLVAALLEDDGAAPLLAASLHDAAPPELSAGYAEDWPDWPPQESPSAEPLQSTEPLQIVEPVQTTGPVQTAPVIRPSQFFSGPSTPASPAESAQPDPSALLSTRSAWLGAAPTPAQPQQTGWLAAPGEASQTRWHDAQPTPGQPAAAAGGAAAGAAGAGTMPLGQSESWQDHAGGGGGQGGFAPGWASGTPVARPADQAKPLKAPSAAKTWIAAALAVLVMATLGFVVWKTAFAAKTYTDPKYGYSFSYPGRWDFAEDAAQFASFSSMAGSSGLLGGAVAGYGDDQNLDDFAVVGVVVFDTSNLGLGDPSLWGAQFQTNLDLAASQDPGIAIVEPLSPTTVAGVSGYRGTLTLASGGFSVTTGFCFLVDDQFGYMAIAMAPESVWPDNQKAFDAFFDSFKPGSTII